MRNTARILGIVGGILGVIAAIIILVAGGTGEFFGLPLSGFVTSLGWLALVFSVLGIIGGALAISQPGWAGVLMIIAAIGGFVFATLLYIPAGVLLLIGGILALLGR